MSEERSFENEEVLGRAIAVTNQERGYIFDIVSDHELRYSNLEGHVLAIYDVDDASSPIVLTPYFNSLRTYNVPYHFNVPKDKIYYIVNITEYTGKDLSPSAEEDSEDRFQGILGEQSIKEAIEDKDEEDVVNKPSHYTYGSKFEVIEIVEEITKQYPPELAFAIGNAIKYISRAEYKNGKEDIKKSLWYLNRVLENWDDAHE